MPSDKEEGRDVDSNIAAAIQVRNEYRIKGHLKHKYKMKNGIIIQIDTLPVE